jgi:NTP pyrophosphatase (non-canonical NTP hydrolase)
VDFNEYQKLASATALYPGKKEIGGIAYCALGLTGEAGEFANKVKKVIRGDKNLLAVSSQLADELGDVLWYLAELADNLGVPLEVIAKANIEKLSDRKARGVVQGSGDTR